MKKIGTICLFEISRIFKKPQSYMLMFAMPLLFTLLFGSLFGSEESTKIKLAIVDQDQSEMSQTFVNLLKENETFKLKQQTMAEAEKLVEEKSIPGMILLGKGFESQIINEKEPVVMFKHGPEFTSSMVVSEIIGNGLSKIMIEAKGAELWSKYSGGAGDELFEKISSEVEATHSSIEKVIVTKSLEQSRMSNMSERAAGFTVMFVMMVIMISTGAILEAKNNGVWSRLLTTPTSKTELMVGYLFAFFIIGWLQFAVLMISSSILFDVDWGRLDGIFLLVSATLLCVIGLGLLIASYSKTVEQQSALGNIIIVSTCMLGGVYWPLEIVPSFMQKIADFVPQTWAMKGFTEISARGGNIVDITMPVLVLLAFAIVFLSIGINRVRSNA
ncbi:ABC transporter permease [Ferdinandcohnia quinoae]|uniref:ABC transporter permease n=1 Tax=Fredinandcohnia quinoae TaxID=2918902 RepID=A0AAW5EA43_9BACI|nr:ABC transporter permease [Fredinandcohnia sp. SECRCQ15]